MALCGWSAKLEPATRMDKVLNTAVLANVWNWPRVWLMLLAGIAIVILTVRAIPHVVPTETAQ